MSNKRSIILKNSNTDRVPEINIAGGSGPNGYAIKLDALNSNGMQVDVHHNFKTLLYNAMAIDANANAVIRVEKNASSVTFTAIDFTGNTIPGNIEYRIRK